MLVHTVPFTSVIPGGLQLSKIISITGKPLSTAKRFTINIVCEPSGDIALHFDVRLRYGEHVNKVVRSSRINGQWGVEETRVSYFPFAPNQKFEMMVLAGQNSFKVEINNQNFVEFVHRLKPLTRITHISVTGDVRLSQVRFQ